MDRITQGFLNEFVELNDIAKLPQHKQFEQFAAYVTVRRHYNGETFDPGDIHTGGGGDLGIDAVAVLVNGALVTDVENLADHEISEHIDATFVFVQADRGANFEGKKISDFGFGVKDFFDAEPKLKRNVEIASVAETMEALYANGAKFRPGNPVCRLYYVTTGTWPGDGDLEARRVQVVQDLRAMQIFREVEFVCLGAEQLQQLYRQSILLAMRYLANPTPKPPMNSREMEGYCKEILDALDNVIADDLCAKAASIVEEEADRLFNRDVEGGFHRDDIRTQPFTEAVVARCKKEMEAEPANKTLDGRG